MILIKAFSHMDLTEIGTLIIIQSIILYSNRNSLIQNLRNKLRRYVVLTSCVCLTLQQQEMLMLEAVQWRVCSNRKFYEYSLFQVSELL